jgi:lipoprotein signal peptidase
VRWAISSTALWIGPFHWPTFNVADIAVTCGAIALAVAFWQEGRQRHVPTGEQADTAEA